MVNPSLTHSLWGLEASKRLKASMISHVNVQCHVSGGNKRIGLYSSEPYMDSCLTDSKSQP